MSTETTNAAAATAGQSWLESRLPLCAALRTLLAQHPIPRDYSYGATLGALSAFTLLLLVLSGFVLALGYVPSEGRAFASIQETIRAVNYGWLIHLIHRTGTTALFALFYLRLFRQLRRGGYTAPGELAWFLLLAQFALLLVVGWIGFTLADGAVSYWSLNNALAGAAQLPGAFGALGAWFFGGAAANPGTLARMAIFHYALALAVIGVASLHFAARRAAAPALAPHAAVPFHPYGTTKTFVALVGFALIFAVLLFFHPHLDQSAENFIAATRLSVPVTVLPPWYVAPFAAIGATLPGAFGSVAIVIAAFAVLVALPWLDRKGVRGGLYGFVLGLLALDVIGLGIVGGTPPSAATTILGDLFTLWYFFHFLVLTPLLTGRPRALAPAKAA